jgi:hypothetical protein
MKLLKAVLFSVLCILSLDIDAQEAQKKISIFRDSIDNAYDASDWLINKKGLLVVPTFITEPAVGYGAAAGAIYFHSSYTEKSGPPSMTGVLGGGTQNGTWFGGAFHIGHWMHDKLRYTGALARTNVNIGFYGAGYLGILDNEPVNLNLDAWVLFQQLISRVKETNIFIGGKYLLMSTNNTFEIPIDNPEFTGTEFNSTLSEVSAILNYDSRNNVFSPSKGFFIQLTGTYSDTWLGGDTQYGRLGVDALGFFPASKKLNVGIRYGSNHALGDMPFWARPIIQMRGVPLMKYQDKNVTLMETEVSVDVYKRWSVIGFTGIGNAYSSLGEFDEGKSVHTLGTGFRYLMARKFGLKMGVDIAASQDDFGFYIIFGSSWLR